MTSASPAVELDRATVLSQLRERMLAFAASRGMGSLAEDLVQEAMVVIHEKYPHVQLLEELVPLGIQIFRFKAAGEWRKAARHGDALAVAAEDLSSPDPDPESVAVQAELLERLKQGIRFMGDRCRELFRLKLQGKGFAEIQIVMGARTLNTVYTWDLRCRKELLNRLGGRWEP